MNKKLVGVFLVGAILSAGYAFFSEDVRPIKIQVVEEATKKPVKNALVYYELETVRIMNFLGIPILDPLDYRYVIKRKYYTDEHGYVKIPKQKVYLRLYEDLLVEYLHINLDHNAENHLVNPISYLKGAIVENRVDGCKEKYSPKLMFKHIVNLKSLKKESEEIVVELEAW